MLNILITWDDEISNICINDVEWMLNKLCYICGTISKSLRNKTRYKDEIL